MITTALLWLRSDHHWDELSWAGSSRLLHINSGRGSLHVQFITPWPGRSGLELRTHPPEPRYPPHVILGQVVTHGTDVLSWGPPVGAFTDNAGSVFMAPQPTGPPLPPFITYRYRRVPYPAILAALLALTMIPLTARAIRKLVRAHRTAALLCPECGYDLRATPARCPECGHTPTGPNR